MQKEKIIFDADPGNRDIYEACTGGHSCPDFMLNEQTNVVTLIDKQHRRVPMSISSFNSFVRAIRCGEADETAVQLKLPSSGEMPLACCGASPTCLGFKRGPSLFCHIFLYIPTDK